ncbi:transcription factor e(y)2-domain-containing protein, partial [Gorgonomyces haynaldii]
EKSQLKLLIDQKLQKTGEKDKLKETLRLRLVEAGWREEVKELAKDLIRKKGIERITVDDLVTEITPKARQLVPERVKQELLQKIRKFIADNE